MYPDSRLHRAVLEYLNEMSHTGLTDRYIQENRLILKHFTEYCHSQGVGSVNRITPEIARGFVGRYKTFSASYQKIAATVVRRFLAFHESPTALRMKMKISGSSRTRVDWLTAEQCDQLLNSIVKPAEAVLFGGALYMGLRRIEILRMTVGDAQQALSIRRLAVHGKGGKYRPVPLQMDYADILTDYLRFKGPCEPKDLLLGFGRRRAEDILEIFRKRSGMSFGGYHTLRRTFGRLLWDNGVPIESIAELYGHSSVDMTKMYIGLNMSDMEKAMTHLIIPRTAKKIAR